MVGAMEAEILRRGINMYLYEFEVVLDERKMRDVTTLALEEEEGS